MAQYHKRPSPQQSGKYRSGSARPPVSPAANRFQKQARRVYGGAKRFLSDLRNGGSTGDADPRRWILLVLGFLALVAILSGVFWFFTRKNAFEVYLDQIKIGVIKKGDDVTPENLTREAVAKLVEQAGAQVEVNETIKLEPTHAGSKSMDSKSYIVSELSKKFTYKVEAAVITVDGKDMVIVKSVAEAEKIKDSIIDPYVQEGTKIVSRGFVEDVGTRTQYVNKGDILPNDKAHTVLTDSKDTPQSYTVKSGDSFWSITSQGGLTTEELLALNPGLDPDPTKLKVGTVITMTVPTPLLSVKIVEEVVLTEVDPSVVEYRYNPDRSKSYSRVIQQGKDGQKEVTYHITRINGFETGEREPVNTVSLVASVPEIIEKGMK